MREREKEEEKTHLLPLFLESIVCKAYTHLHAPPTHTETFTTNLLELLRREIVSQFKKTHVHQEERNI